MDRRDAIRSLGLISAHALFPAILTGFVSSCGTRSEKNFSSSFFDAQELEAVQTIIDVIIPETKTKSASQVGVDRFLDEVFAKCLNKEQQDVLKTGLDQYLQKVAGGTKPDQVVQMLDKEAFDDDLSAAWFKTLKQYTLVGFFTSQEGETKASNYVRIPGDYQGEIEADENTLNYGNTSLRFYL